MTTPDNSDEIISRVLARFNADDEPERNRSYRACIVLDETVAALGPALKDADFNVIVIVPECALETYEPRDLYLAGRSLITSTTPGYLYDAPALGFGIVGLDALPSVDDAPSYKDNTTARSISRVMSEYSK